MKLESMNVEKKPKIMIIPMIDIIFFLLVFFMMSMLSMVVQKSINLNLPQTATAKVNVEQTIPISITSDGTIYVEKEKIAKDDFRRRMEIEKEGILIWQWCFGLIRNRNMEILYLYLTS